VKAHDHGLLVRAACLACMFGANVPLGLPGNARAFLQQ
jgi:hypothetical protein